MSHQSQLIESDILSYLKMQFFQAEDGILDNER
eukprot:COSAG04_NODE_11608_length_699_cov_0.945000_1_plen_33_part_00